MQRYALVSPRDTVERISHAGKGGIDPSVPTKEGWRWLKLESENASYDSKFQIQTGPEYIVEDGRVIESYALREKTEEELTNDKQNKIASINQRRISLLFPPITEKEYDEYNAPKL